MLKPLLHIPLIYCTVLWWLIACSQTGAQQLSDWPANKQALLQKGVALYDQGDYQTASKVFEELVSLARVQEDERSLGEVYYELGSFYRQRNLSAKALDFLISASELLSPEFSGERANIIVPAMEESPSTYLLEVPEDAAIIGEVYNKIGGVYFKQHNYEKAEKYWKKSYQVAEQYKSAKALADACNNLGELARIRKQNDKAINFYRRAIELQEVTNDQKGQLVTWSNIGNIFLEEGDPEAAKHYFDKAYANAQVLQDSNALIHAFDDYGDYYQQKGNTKAAKIWTQRVLTLAQQQQHTELLLASHRRLATLYEQQKNWDSLVYHQQQWTVLQKAYEEKIQRKLSMQIEAEYVVNQQEKELTALRQEALLTEEKARRKDTIQWSLTAILALLLAGALWTVYLKRKHNKVLQAHLQEIEQQHEEKELLLQEIHHRVKNNLQVVTSLLHLQSQDIQDPTTKALFEQSQYRISSMAMIHQMLYQSHNLAAIDYKAYLEQLVSKLVRSVKGVDATLRLDIDIAPIKLNIDTAIPLGLIINELVTNALKYGLDKGAKSVLMVHLKPVHNSSYLLDISDNGKGMDEDWMSKSSSSSLGMRLVHKLTRQLSGELHRVPTSIGTHYQLYFKEITATP